LKAVAETVDSDYFAAKWNKNFFYNSASPSIIIKPSGKPLSKEQYLQLREMVKQAYSGVKNAHKAIIMNLPLEVQNMQMNHRDMEFMNLRKFSREEIAAVFGVPLSVLGLNENSNRATAYIAEYTFMKSITSKLVLIREALNHYYAKHFGEDLYFDFDPVIPKDEEFQMKKYTELVKNNILTINEVRAELGYPEVEWGNQPYTLLTYGMDEQVTKSVKKGFDRDAYWLKIAKRRIEDENFFKGWVSARFTKQEKIILEKLKAQKGLSRIEAEKLADEITAWLLGEDELTTWARFYAKKMGLLSAKASQEFIDEFGLSFSLSDTDPRVLEMIEKRSQKFAKRVNETTYTQLKESLIEGRMAGESEKELAKRVSEIMTLSKRQRAATIARTEIFGCVNQTYQMTMQENGVQKKEWLTAQDERVRDGHREADGQIVKIEEPFSVGGEYLMYPGDPSGSAGNVIGCRCVTIPVV